MAEQRDPAAFMTEDEFRELLRKRSSLARLADVDQWVSAMVMRCAETAIKYHHVDQGLDSYDRDKGWDARDVDIAILAKEVARYISNCKRFYRGKEPEPFVERMTIPAEFTVIGLTTELRHAIERFVALSEDVLAAELFDSFVLESRANGWVKSDWTMAFVAYCKQQAPRVRKQVAAAQASAGVTSAKGGLVKRTDVSNEELQHARDALDACWRKTFSSPRKANDADDVVLGQLWHYARTIAAESTYWRDAAPIDIKRIIGKWLMAWLKLTDNTVVNAGYPLPWMLSNDGARLKAWGLPARRAQTNEVQPMAQRPASTAVALEKPKQPEYMAPAAEPMRRRGTTYGAN